MKNYIPIIFLTTFIPLSSSWAMQAMEDADLAQQTGQDGVTLDIKLPNSAVTFSEAALIDSNGMTNATSTASLVIAPTSYTTGSGIRLLSGSTGNTVATAPVSVAIDADGGATPLLNAEVSMPSDMQRIKIDPFSIFLATGSNWIYGTSRVFNGAAGTIRAGVTELLKIGNNGIEITFKPSNPVKINLQLGAEQQNHMFMFTGGILESIKTGSAGTDAIEIMSKNTSSTNSSLKFNFDLTATNSTGISLTGFYGDINDNGLTFGKDGATDKMNLVLSNVIAGSAGVQDAATFNNLKNASIGNIGIVGASVTNLKVNVKGL